ncbi:scavenger receptor cysteine-rich type 1 protein M130-like [Heterodontus francisci]|uniref:scavenger receptor cysteine-rich type 1 protein M130-like n=1 Tax=Heterodontus francisci TaxID=7792 RepID=UPI00355B2B57
MTLAVKCSGTEAALRDCKSEQRGLYSGLQSHEAGVICSDHRSPRLTSGDSPCSGRLEIQYGEYWGTVCDLDWDLKDANVVCSQLQCGVAMSAPRYAHFGEGIGLIRSDIFECIGNETSLLDCRLFEGTQQECSHRNDASVICSGKHGPRLVDGMNRCSGRVEVLHRDQWWTLCDLYFDMEDANVVCEHLHCGTGSSVPGGAHFGKGTGPMWKENYKCRGNETRLWDCPVSSWDQFSCSHENDASVICTGESSQSIEVKCTKCSTVKHH